ncbi:hypothetical protein JRQ81_012947 [Phrynocephalus forsythii]|uniref:Uncharacterized protein n=1 Tax=Phrynocephalus forsythii TaxID=171643 RepID=A0A9Q0Y064_9SAUR|nr:hypothetical protein JRQ81_012947 [Phrynocephalus forsythii]
MVLDTDLAGMDYHPLAHLQAPLPRRFHCGTRSRSASIPLPDTRHRNITQAVLHIAAVRGSKRHSKKHHCYIQVLSCSSEADSVSDMSSSAPQSTPVRRGGSSK